jgi:hypothetical protein
MLTKPIKIQIGGEFYYIVPKSMVPLDIMRRGVNGSEWVLEKCVADHMAMQKIRTVLSESDPCTPLFNITDQDAIRRLKAILKTSSSNIVFGKRSQFLRPLSTAAVAAWLEKASKSSIGTYAYLSVARNKDQLDLFDENLVAAERYMEGYDGNYSDTLIAASALLKFTREVEIMGSKPFEKLFGANGSKSIEFITRWGMLGAFDRNENISLPERIKRCATEQ